jgi:hypothetical protein
VLPLSLHTRSLSPFGIKNQKLRVSRWNGSSQVRCWGTWSEQKLRGVLLWLWALSQTLYSCLCRWSGLGLLSRLVGGCDSKAGAVAVAWPSGSISKAMEVVATRAAISITWAWRVSVIGGSVKATNEGTVSVVPGPVTRGATVSEADTSEVVVKAVVWVGVGWPVNSL